VLRVEGCRCGDAVLEPPKSYYYQGINVKNLFDEQTLSKLVHQEEFRQYNARRVRLSLYSQNGCNLRKHWAIHNIIIQHIWVEHQIDQWVILERYTPLDA